MEFNSAFKGLIKVISTVSDPLPVERTIQGKHLNYTLIGRNVARFNLYEIMFGRWNKNRSRNCCLNNTNITFVCVLFGDKQYLVKFKRIIISGLVELTSTVSGTLPCGGIIPGKSYYYVFILRNILRLSSLKI